MEGVAQGSLNEFKESVIYKTSTGNSEVCWYCSKESSYFRITQGQHRDRLECIGWFPPDLFPHMTSCFLLVNHPRFAAVLEPNDK
jgi:hypothetical protein